MRQQPISHFKRVRGGHYASLCCLVCGLAAFSGVADDMVFTFTVDNAYTNLYRGGGAFTYSPGYSTFTNTWSHQIRGPGAELDRIHSLYAFSDWGFNFGYEQGITNPWAPYDLMLSQGGYEEFTDPATVVVYRVPRVDIGNTWADALLTWWGTNSLGGTWSHYLPITPFPAGIYDSTNGGMVYSESPVFQQIDKYFQTSSDTVASVQYPILWRDDNRTKAAMFEDWGLEPGRMFKGHYVARRDIYEITGTVYEAKREKWPDYLVTVAASVDHNSANEPNEEYWAPSTVSNYQYRVPDYAAITSAWANGVNAVKKYRVNRTYKLRIVGDQ